MAPAPEGLDDAHTPAAARTGLKRIGRFYRFGRFRRRRCGQELADASDAGLASAAGEKSVMPNAMKAAWQDMLKKAADELVGMQRHDLLALRPAAAIVFVFEGDTIFVEGDQSPVRDRDAMRVAGEISQHRFGSGKRRLGVDMPLLLPERDDMTNDCTPLLKAF